MVNTEMRRVLIDQGSSANILFGKSFDKLGLRDSDLYSYVEDLVGFSREKVRPDEYISLYLILGTKYLTRTIKVDFMVVDNSPYWVIFLVSFYLI